MLSSANTPCRRDALHWQPCTVTTESGQDLPAQYAALMEHDPHAEATYIMHWRLGRLCCTFKVCIRRGWERLREFLVRVRQGCCFGSLLSEAAGY